jgi:hypothetical protein
MSLRRLRHYGIYRLPGVVRPVYAIHAGGKFCLYDFKFGSSLPPRFVVEEDGHLLNWHDVQLPSTVEDLVDTGEDYAHQKRMAEGRHDGQGQ